MAQTIGQHGVAAFTSPVNGDLLNATVVLSNDNTTRSAYVDHDIDSGIHVQSSLLAARPAAGTAGRKWMTTDTGAVKLWFDTGAAWEEIAYVPSVGGNAATATALQTPRNINGVAFNGTANITVTAAAGTVTGATLASNVLASSLTSVGTLAGLTVTAPIAGSVTGASGSTTGNAATATALQTARNINGVAFDGTANITLPVSAADASTLTGATLASNVLASSLTSVGTLTALTTSGTTSLATTAGAVTIRSVVYTFPASQGAASTTLTNNGSGTLSWVSAGGISSVSSDPSPLAEGAVWYNTVQYALKTATIAPLSAFASGGSMATARYLIQPAGTASATFAIGGFDGTTTFSSTETYNGTSWSGGAALTAARSGGGGCGTTSAALAVGGTVASATTATIEQYNGTSWSAGGSLATARVETVAAGTSSASIAIGGRPSTGSTYLSSTEFYNGTTWSSGATMTTGRAGAGIAGSSTNALVFGGQATSAVYNASSELYNGFVWYVANAMTGTRYNCGGNGTSGGAMAIAGFVGTTGVGTRSATTLQYSNVWATGPAIAIGTIYLASVGTVSSTLAFGGFTTVTVATSQSATSSTLVAKFITSAP